MSAAAPVFRWTETYSVSVAELDRQHQKLFDTVNELERALRSGKGHAAIEEVLGKLVHYATEHFDSEESLMAKHDFPGLSTHRTQHQMFCSKIENFLEDYRLSKPGVPVSVLLYLQSWLKQHVLKTDKLYSAYLNARGVR